MRPSTSKAENKSNPTGGQWDEILRDIVEDKGVKSVL